MRSAERAALAIVTAFALGACGGGKKSQDGGPPEVGVVTIEKQAALLEVELPGRTSAFESSEVRPQVSGVIKERLFKEGADVRAGQALYQIDPATYRAAYAQANLAAAQAKDERYSDLVKINAVSKQDADDAKAARQQAEAAVVQARAAVDTAKINLDYTRVYAPISGRIGRSGVTPGALVTANQTDALTSIQRLDKIYVDVNQSASDLIALQRGLQAGKIARGGLSVRLKLQDGSDYETTGTLSATDVIVDPQTGSVALRAIFPNPHRLLLPGMYVRAIIAEGVQKDAILAPQQGVARDQRGLPTAFVVDAQGKAQLRTLETGRAVGDKWLVTKGLEAGDKLIVEGVQYVQPGAAVKAVPVSELDNPVASTTPSSTAPGSKPAP